jgi:hypothetical protein
MSQTAATKSPPPLPFGGERKQEHKSLLKELFAICDELKEVSGVLDFAASLGLLNRQHSWIEREGSLLARLKEVERKLDAATAATNDAPPPGPSLPERLAASEGRLTARAPSVDSAKDIQ